MQQLARTVVRNSASGVVAQGAVKVLSFCFTIFVVRSLGAEVYGQYASVLAFGAIFVFLGDLGLAPYMVREVAREREDGQGTERIQTLYGNVMALRVVLALGAVVLMITAAWLTKRPPVMISAIALSGLGMLLYSVQGASATLLMGFERLDLPARAQISNQFVFVALGAAVLWLGVGYLGLIVASLVGIALMAYRCWRYVAALGITPGRATMQAWPTLLRASLPFGLIGFALGFSHKFDAVLLNIFRSDIETGYYSAMYNLVFSAVTLSNILNTSLYPSLARQAVSAPHQLPEIYARVLRYLLAISLPIAVGGWALAPQLVPFLFDESFRAATPALQVVIWVVPLMFVSEFLGYIVVIDGQERRVARAVIASTGCNIALNLLVVPRFGFLGAAVITVVTELILVGQYLWLLRAPLRQLDWKSVLARPTLAVMLMGAVIWPIHLPLLARVGLGAVIYLLLLPALGVLGRDELSFVRGLRRRAELSISG